MIVRELFTRLGMKTDANSFDKADKALGKVKAAAAAVAALLVGRKVVLGFRDIIAETTKAADSIAKMSKRLGVNAQALQELQYAAQIAGASQQDLNSGMRILSKFADEAAQGTKEYTDEFERLGVTVTDAAGQLKPTEQIFTELADGMQRLSTYTERTAIAQKLLGRGGAALVPLLGQGSKAIEALRKEAQETGGIFTDEFLVAAELTTDELLRMDKGLLALKIAITDKFRPAFDWFVSRLKWAYGALATLVEETNILEAALGVLGAVLLAVGIKFVIAFAVPIALALALTAAIALLVIVVDDIITSFKGGDSAGKRFADTLSDMYDWFMQLGEAAPIIQALLLPFQAFLKAVNLAKEALFALVTLMTGGGMSGFELVGEHATEEVKDLLKKTEDIQKGAVKTAKGLWEKLWTTNVTFGEGGLALQPAGGVSASPGTGGSSTVINAPVTVNATTLPGQSSEEFGTATALAVKKVLSSEIESAAAEALPRVGI